MQCCTTLYTAASKMSRLARDLTRLRVNGRGVSPTQSITCTGFLRVEEKSGAQTQLFLRWLAQISPVFPNNWRWPPHGVILEILVSAKAPVLSGRGVDAAPIPRPRSPP